MKKILSISLYGDVKYLNGLLKNYNLFLEFFHDFVFYFYVDKKFEGILEKKIPQKNLVIIYKSAVSKADGMFWRFEPILNDIGDICLVRDADYIPSKYETELINEFIKSNYTFHILRAHTLHTMPILGGLFGIKKNNYKNFKNGFSKWFLKNNFNNIIYNDDQIFLSKYVYNLVIKNTLIHTSNVVFIGEHFKIIYPPKNFIIGSDDLSLLDTSNTNKLLYFLPVKILNFFNFKYIAKRVYSTNIYKG
jgi:hypothetical protein